MSKKTIFIGLAVVAIIGVLGFARANRDGVVHAEHDISHLSQEQKTMTVYKSATCGCCAQYVAYLKDIGFNVEVKDTEEMDSIKEKYGVPADLGSCHTTVAGDYVIEGHIPFEGVNKILSDQPEIKGIALPGMPSATPGMPGAKTEEWNIRQLNNDGSISTYMTM